MLRTYEGYVERGQIFPIGFPSETVGRKKVLITVLEESTVDTARRLDALDEFFAAIENCDEEVPEFERVKLRGIDWFLQDYERPTSAEGWEQEEPKGREEW